MEVAKLYNEKHGKVGLIDIQSRKNKFEILPPSMEKIIKW